MSNDLERAPAQDFEPEVELSINEEKFVTEWLTNGNNAERAYAAEVNSQAAVAITTGAVNAMKAEPKIGRAEALRRSIAALIKKGGENTHPSVWAPFVLVGNGEQ